MTIRPFQDRDYPGIVSVANAIYSDYPWSVNETRHEDARYNGAKFVQRRFVASLPDGRVVAHGGFHHVPNMYHPQKFWIDVLVHPEFQRRGFGSRLYDHVMAALGPSRPVTLWSNVRETFEDSLRFATRRGFAEIRRAWESRLDVASFDPTPFQARAEAAVSRMAVVTVAEERERDPRWREKLHGMHLDVSADVPQPDVFTPQTIDQFQQRLLDNPAYVPDGHILAKDDDRYVAESFVFRSEERPDILYQGLTGTRREYRGRGIALALKLRVVDFAKRRGYREIRTWNDTLNTPMLHINETMGFVRQPAWVMLAKTL
jgi:GNAT superfamily N-acetyltransferase